jgi:hypothetical protein
VVTVCTIAKVLIFLGQSSVLLVFGGDCSCSFSEFFFFFAKDSHSFLKFLSFVLKASIFWVTFYIPF